MSFSGGYLRRLEPSYYRGNAIVHWSMTIDRRRSGWLNEMVHLRFRESLLHTMTRYGLLCPSYCLMPDHLHILWMGMSEGSDQLLAASFFRKYFNRVLKTSGFLLMDQAYDHVLKEEERERGAFESLLFYISENPVRAELVAEAEDWSFSGSLAAGYPDFDWRGRKFVERLWAIYLAESSPSGEG